MKFEFKSIFEHCLTILLCFLFCCLFASIPLCSFRSNLTYVTWIITIAFCLLVAVYIIFVDKKVNMGLITFSLGLFGLSALLSSIFVKFIGFVFTPFLLVILALLLILFISPDSRRFNFLLFSAYIGVVVFLMVFVIFYRKEIFSFKFYRLGSNFGDENDISVFMSFGFIVSIYYLFKERRLYILPVFLALSILFLFAGFLTGSKIFIFSVFGVFIVFIIALLKQRKFVFLSLTLISFILILVLFFMLPQFSTIRERMLSFISTLFGNQNGSDLSTIYRIEMFECGLRLFLKKPLFGYGTSGFQYFGGFNDGWSHNHLSESLCNYGLIGTIFSFFPFIYSFIISIRHNLLKNKTIIIYGLVFCFISMISIPFFIEKFFSLFCGLLFGYCSSLQVYKKTFFLGVKK